MLIVYLLVRVGLGLVTGDGDTEYYQDWAYAVADDGFTEVYTTSGFDYPPLILYFYYPIGELYKRYVPTRHARLIHDTPVFVLLIKAPNVIFDFVLAGLFYWLISRGGLWGRERTGPGWGRFAALLYLWNPVVLWDTAYWGQVDGIHTALALTSFAALAYGRVAGMGGMAAAGGLLAASGMMKVLVAPLAPLLALATTGRNGMRGFLVTGAGGLALTTLVLLPFLLTGRLDSVADRLLSANTTMAYSSCNAHNLWMLLGSWEPSNIPIVGPMTLQHIGVLLFLAAYLLLLGRSWRWLRSKQTRAPDYLANLFVLAAAICGTFFYFTANLHANHLFIVVPLLLIVSGRSRALAWLAASCSLAVFLNLTLHDMNLAYNLPFPLSARSPVLDPYLIFDLAHSPGRYSAARDLHYTWVQLVGIWFNVLLVTIVCATTYVLAWRLPAR